MAAAKKRENFSEDVALVAGTQQNLSNLYSLDIYGFHHLLLCLLIFLTGEHGEYLKVIWAEFSTLSEDCESLWERT
jgi:hypothetical protein